MPRELSSRIFSDYSLVILTWSMFFDPLATRESSPFGLFLAWFIEGCYSDFCPPADRATVESGFETLDEPHSKMGETTTVAVTGASGQVARTLCGTSGGAGYGGQ
jgi:hypothetical protein